MKPKSAENLAFVTVASLAVTVLAFILWIGYLTRPVSGDEVPNPPLDDFQKARLEAPTLTARPVLPPRQPPLYVMNSRPRMVLDLDEVQAVILGDNDFHVYFKGRALTLNVVGDPKKFLRAWQKRRKQ